MEPKIFSRILCIALVLVLSACTPSPKAIDYGNDACHFCKMTVVDKIHGAELVTAKGKVFTFDAVECMVNFLRNNDQEIALYLINHYGTPEELIDATQAYYLISKELPSPMGAYLTAFKSKAEAEKVQAEKSGDIYDWEGLLTHMNP
ncbi:nitrous oxide reductase accessory protein NosL [Sediminicola luteus]|uniref:Copper chaperone NosL n=1 Tax=Sediminicola luteus TaxID=319238 RepID=A0A2A4G560_9FLAO|nr:nitrous oxide reductase accessory protein NosL [Sediminicola luteus]PCE64099.1 hypothetical protein B7P33_12760 [Sediminicola luteus]